MNIIISKASLSKAITSVSKVVSTNSTIPVLSGVLLRAENGILELQSTNIDQSIRIKVAANVDWSSRMPFSARRRTPERA